MLLVASFDPHQAGFQFVEDQPWFAGLHYRMGVDGISVLFVLLTAFLMPLCIVASWKSIKNRVLEYMIAFLVLETLVIGVFCALDLIVFYLFFEGQLIPMFLIIGIWGGKNRVYAAYKFFLYTLLGSVLMLAAILAMVGIAHTTSIPALMAYHFAPKTADLAVAGLLRLVRGEDADVAGAHLAARRPRRGADRRLGDPGRHPAEDGRLRLPALLAADVPGRQSHYFTPLVFALSVIAIVYTSLVAFRQTDIKKLIAYSSVAHMGFVTMGIFSGNVQGEQGAIFQMLSHGVISGALFLCVGVVYDRMHTREIAFYGGLANRMPWYAAVFMLFTMGNVGLPGTCGFVGEILTLTGVYRRLDLDGDLRRHRRDPLGGLCAHPLSARDLRRAHQSEARRHHRPGLARGGDLRAADRRHPGARPAARPGVRPHRRLGRAAGRRLPAVIGG